MGISRQSLHPGSPPQSRAVRWRGAPSPAGRGNRSRSRRRAPQWRRWEPVAPDHCLAGREVEFPSFRSAPRTESLQTLCWREMDSNRRSSAEFGNFVLAGVSFGVSQSSNGLWTVPATPSVVPLRRRMMSAQSPSAHVALVADLSTSCSDSQVTRHLNCDCYNEKEDHLASRAAAQTLALATRLLLSGFGVRFCIDDDTERGASAHNLNRVCRPQHPD